MMQEYTIHPLVVGINETDQGVMTYLRDYGKRIHLPIYAFYLAGGDQKILVDSGLEEFMVPEGAEEALGYKVQEFEEALAAVELAPDDIDLIILPHCDKGWLNSVLLGSCAQNVAERAPCSVLVLRPTDNAACPT